MVSHTTLWLALDGFLPHHVRGPRLGIKTNIYRRHLPVSFRDALSRQTLLKGLLIRRILKTEYICGYLNVQKKVGCMWTALIGWLPHLCPWTAPFLSVYVCRSKFAYLRLEMPLFKHFYSTSLSIHPHSSLITRDTRFFNFEWWAMMRAVEDFLNSRWLRFSSRPSKCYI